MSMVNARRDLMKIAVMLIRRTIDPRDAGAAIVAVIEDEMRRKPRDEMDASEPPALLAAMGQSAEEWEGWKDDRVTLDLPGAK